MSVIVAIKEKEKVVFGFDMGGISYASIEENFCPTNVPVFNLGKIKGCFVGIPGRDPAANILKTLDKFDLISELEQLHKAVDFEFVIRKLIPRIKECLSSFEILYKGNDGKDYLPMMLFAYKNQLFEINGNGYVRTIDDYCVLSQSISALNAAQGVLANSEGKRASKRIADAIHASMANGYGQSATIYSINTKDMEYKVIK